MKLRQLYEDFSPEINLLTTSQEDLETAFDLMEFEGFFEKDMNPNEHTYPDSVKHAYDWLLHKGHYSDYEDDEEMMGSVTVYGSGGGNRYYVRPDGRVDFSVQHAIDSKSRDAKSLGFNLFPTSMASRYGL